MELLNHTFHLIGCIGAGVIVYLTLKHFGGRK